MKRTKRPKRALGKFLLTSLQKRRSGKKTRKLKTKISSKKRSKKRSKARPQTRTPVKSKVKIKRRLKSKSRIRALSLSRMRKPRVKKNRLQEVPVQVPEVLQTVVSNAPSTDVLTPVASPPAVVVNGFGAPPALSTQDILKPNDQIRLSIEAFLLDQRSPHTRLAYGKDLKRFVKFLHLRNHEQGFESINRTLLIAYKEFLLSEHLEHTTVDRHLATLKSFFKWLVEDGHLFKSPADGVRFMNPKRMSTTIGFSDEEVKKMLTLPNLHSRSGALHYAILMVLFYCGLRRSELCSLKMESLGTERNQRVVRLRGKGNAERMIVVIPPVWNAIRYYLFISNRDLQSDGYLFSPIRNNRTGILDKPLDTSMIFYIVRKYARLAGIANRVSPHSCRATAISNARDHQVPDRAIQEFAGWSSPDMITRYDKRKSTIENSAAHSISYGHEDPTHFPASPGSLPPSGAPQKDNGVE